MKAFNKIITGLCTGVLLVSVSSCLIEGKVSLVFPYVYENSFQLDDPDGTWDKTETVTYNDIVLDLDISDETTVTGLDIEGVGCYVENPGGSVSVENVSLTVIEEGSDQKVPIFQNQSFSAGSDTVWVSASLITAGVEIIKKKFEDYIIDDINSGSFTLNTTGNSVPAGSPIANTSLRVFVQASIITEEDLSGEE